MADADNIIIGPASSITIDGSPFGFTQGGSSFRHEIETVDVIADQVLGVVQKRKTTERMYITVNMLELTLDNMAKGYDWPVEGSNLSSLTLGYNFVCATGAIAIVLIGPAPSCGTRTITFPSCIGMGTREYNMSREEPTVVAIEFEALKDAAGAFGTITDTM